MSTRGEKRLVGRSRAESRKSLRLAFAYGYGTPEEDVEHPLSEGSIDDKNMFWNRYSNACRMRKSVSSVYDFLRITVTVRRISHEIDGKILNELHAAASALGRGSDYQTTGGPHSPVTVAAVRILRPEEIGGVDLRPGSVQPGRVREQAQGKEKGEVRGDTPREPDLERGFFSQGPDVAEARLMRLAAQMVARYPERRESLKPKVIEAIDGDNATGTEVPPRPERPLQAVRRELKTPPRIDHPFLAKLTGLWDQRTKVSRDAFMAKFQEVLDEFHASKSLGTLDLNRNATTWINFIAKKRFFKLKYEKSSVILECSNQNPEGYFRCKFAFGKSRTVPGSGSSGFPKLSLLSLADEVPDR